MARLGDGGELLKCSFCGKSQKQVKKLIAGPGVYICDECIDLCNEIIEEEFSVTEEVSFTDASMTGTGAFPGLKPGILISWASFLAVAGLPAKI